MEGYKKGLCSLKLENMSKVYNAKGEIDMTLVRATFSILDFTVSGNKQIVPKKVALRDMHTLEYKPLVCEYIETTDYENPNDDFTDHVEKEIILRNGEEYLSSGTTPIGVCEKAYVGVVANDEGEEIDVIMGDFLLWLYRFPNEISLINDFYEKGETLYTSCEHYFKSTSQDDNGNDIIDSLIFDGHALLGRGVEPAYASSKLIAFNENWEKAVNTIRKQNNKKEDDDMEINTMFDYLKSTNAISAGSIRWRLYDALSQVMIADEYNNMYLSEYDIFQTEGYFTYETYNDGYKMWKVNFTVDENDVITVDFEGKMEAQYKHSIELIEAEKSLNTKKIEFDTLTKELEDVKVSLNAKELEVETVVKDLENLKVSLNTKDEEIKIANDSKVEISDKLNTSNEMVISLNSKVEELSGEIETMKPIVDEYNKAEFEKSLNALKNTYKVKFENVGALDIFEEDSTQELISKCVNATEVDFKRQLNQLIVDNIKIVEKETDGKEETHVKSVNSLISCKTNKNLVTDFVDPYEEICGFKK